jgi:hypothetical protein
MSKNSTVWKCTCLSWSRSWEIISKLYPSSLAILAPKEQTCSAKSYRNTSTMTTLCLWFRAISATGETTSISSRPKKINKFTNTSVHWTTPAWSTSNSMTSRVSLATSMKQATQFAEKTPLKCSWAPSFTQSWNWRLNSCNMTNLRKWKGWTNLLWATRLPWLMSLSDRA